MGNSINAQTMRAFARSVIDRFLDNIDLVAGKHGPLVPPRKLRRYVGHGDFAQAGEEFFKYFIGLGNMKKTDHVLDVGCGIGRMAIPLTTYLMGGKYEGFDIVPEAIDWCSKHITKAYPSFRFQLADIYNATYHPKGKNKASAYTFPYENDMFDFVFLTSIFTHLRPDDMENYLREIARVMRPGGRCLITYFLLNDESRELIATGMAHRQFVHDIGGAMTAYVDRPEDAIAYDEKSIRALYGAYGLGIIEPIRFGSWCQRPNPLSYQDIIIADKVAG